MSKIKLFWSILKEENHLRFGIDDADGKFRIKIVLTNSGVYTLLGLIFILAIL